MIISPVGLAASQNLARAIQAQQQQAQQQQQQQQQQFSLAGQRAIQPQPQPTMQHAQMNPVSQMQQTFQSQYQQGSINRQQQQQQHRRLLVAKIQQQQQQQQQQQGRQVPAELVRQLQRQFSGIFGRRKGVFTRALRFE